MIYIYTYPAKIVMNYFSIFWMLIYIRIIIYIYISYGMHVLYTYIHVQQLEEKNSLM
jgi:hypothetical protein